MGQDSGLKGSRLRLKGCGAASWVQGQMRDVMVLKPYIMYEVGGALQASLFELRPDKSLEA